MKPPASGVAVRMYNTGFGDCFLLAFRAEDGTARYLLIDCGVHHQYSGQAKIMQAVATDIARATGGRLHVVVVTHQHTDHLYGVKHGREIFEKMQIDDLWLAWTEDPSDAVAGQLKKRYALYTRALAAAVQQIGLSNEPLAEQIQSVLGFEYPNALAAAGGQSAELDYLRAKSGKKLQSSKDYRHPGEPPLALPGVKGVKVYVLGPPRNAQRIDVLEKESEMYPELAALNARGAFAAAVLAAADEAAQEEVESLIRRSQPFDQSLIITPKAARRHRQFKRFFANAYGFSTGAQHGPAWRRIEPCRPAWIR